MLIFLGVENFAKIEKAKVCINSYTLLVGPNNSGKTYFMQLVQGVNERLIDLVDGKAMKILMQIEETASNIDTGINFEYRSYVISQDNISRFVAYLNTKLNKKKEQIIREIFGREVPVGKLYIEVSLEKENYEIMVCNDVKALNTIKFMQGNMKSLLENAVASMYDYTIGTLVKRNDDKSEENIIRYFLFAGNDDLRMVTTGLESLFGCRGLFLPASRAGLMLLYRDFFAIKTDDVISYQVKHEEIIEKNNDSNLTQPVYQFLRFLQTYSINDSRMKEYEMEISFFEENLIEGHLSTNSHNNFSYYSNADHVRIPMYMASSMINEIAPFVFALTSNNAYDGFVIDEIEASLHPQKQLELVRFLNRLSNKEIKLILSTHSDTFASKVNNLYILSNYIKQNKGKDILDKMGLEKEDLMSPDRLFVYEFVSQSNGKSIVKEIPGDSKAGFQFDLFTDSAMHLYNEALKIGEILQDDQA